MNRLDWLGTRDERAAARPSGPSLADALADRDVALIRIRSRCDARFRPYHDLVAWTASYRRIHLGQADRDALAAWYMELHPDVDWSRDHQVVVATGEVQSAPDAWEPGFIPEDDLTFNGGPAVHLPTLATTGAAR